MYARMMTVTARPGQEAAVEKFYTETAVSCLEDQPGFHGIYLLHNPGQNKYVTIALWASEADMKAFDDCMIGDLATSLTGLLQAAPMVDIYRVAYPTDVEGLLRHIGLTETSLGVRMAKTSV